MVASTISSSDPTPCNLVSNIVDKDIKSVYTIVQSTGDGALSYTVPLGQLNSWLNVGNNSAAGAFTIYIPVASAAIAGQSLRISTVAGSASTQNILVRAGAGAGTVSQLYGLCITYNTVATTSGTTTLTFVGGTYTVGDYATLFCNGTNWEVLAFSRAATGVTLA